MNAPAQEPLEDPRQLQLFLDTPAAEGAALLIFALGAVLIGESLLLPAVLPIALPGAVVAVAVTLLGPISSAVERGRQRPPSWSTSILIGAGATVFHVGLTIVLAAQPPTLLDLLARALPVLVLGGLIPRLLSPRLDRGESGWRLAVRCGPPLGATPLAGRIAALRGPTPLRWLGWLLLPLTLPLRALCLLMILGYQLTLSRLMPPACRYEPTCSRYGFHAYLQHGCFRGSLLTALRLVRCSPIGNGGYDPVPSVESVEANTAKPGEVS